MWLVWPWYELYFLRDLTFQAHLVHEFVDELVVTLPASFT